MEWLDDLAAEVLCKLAAWGTAEADGWTSGERVAAACGCLPEPVVYDVLNRLADEGVVESPGEDLFRVEPSRMVYA